jgi:DNA-binding transcriptional LysR family regulator
MDLNHLEIFVKVVQLGSFTAAAEALKAPKSSVSRAVSALEDALGVRLLQRTTRSLSLTDAGRTYFERVQGALGALTDATSEVMDAGGAPRGLVRLTAPADMAILAVKLGSFLARYPGIKLQLLLTNRRVDLVQEGVDLAVRAGALTDSTLIARRVGVSRMGLYASVAYLAQHGTPTRLEELPRHACVLFRGQGGTGIWQLTGPEGKVQVQVQGQLDADDFGFVHQCVAAGLGIGLIPGIRVNCPGQETLVRVLPAYAFRAGDLHVVTPSRQQEAARVRLLRDYLVETLSELVWGEEG